MWVLDQTQHKWCFTVKVRLDDLYVEYISKYVLVYRQFKWNVFGYNKLIPSSKDSRRSNYSHWQASGIPRRCPIQLVRAQRWTGTFCPTRDCMVVFGKIRYGRINNVIILVFLQWNTHNMRQQHVWPHALPKYPPMVVTTNASNSSGSVSSVYSPDSHLRSSLNCKHKTYICYRFM